MASPEGGARTRARGDAEAAAPVIARAGTVTGVDLLAPDLVEVAVALARPFPHRPGQHVAVAFAGQPARDYVPTLRLEAATELNELVFHVRRRADGAPGSVSSALGRTIGPGHLARVKGAFGDAHHRPGEGRLVLAATGAGFAPIWAVARAARCLEPGRETIVVVGARDGRDLYMRGARDWLLGTGAECVLCASRADAGGDVRPGRVTTHLPRLRADDVVYAAGGPEMVAAVGFLAAAVGATFHAMPFGPLPEAAPPAARGLVETLRARWGDPA